MEGGTSLGEAVEFREAISGLEQVGLLDFLVLGLTVRG
jgi:hypothetical protein